jgi:hypothetical protein
MPPISQQGSRAGLITAVVIFAILFVTATIFAFIYNAKATRNALDLENYGREASGIYAKGSINTQDFDALKAARGNGTNFGPNEPLINVAIGQTGELARLIGGAKTTTFADAAKAAKTALDGAKAAVKDTDVKLANDLSSSVGQLAAAVVAGESQIAQLKTERDATAAQVTAAKKQQDEAIAAANKAVADARADAEKAAAEAGSDRTAKGQQVEAMEKARDAERAKAVADAETLRTQIAEKDGAIKKLQKDTDLIRKRLASLRGNVSNAVITQSDGTIIRLPGDNLAYINLGAGDQIAPGLTFEVYDKSEGVPAPANDAAELPQGKASLEVLRVGSTSSECRIVRQTPGTQLTEGDLIANLVYDRNTKYTFFVFGNFDLDHNNVATASDANVIKQLITQWGGKISDKVNVGTDFVVLGVEPVVPAFTTQELEDPVNKKKLEDAQAEATAYQDILQNAGELNIPVMNQNRFLYYVGYYNQASR